MDFKKAGVIFTSTALLFSMYSATAAASSMYDQENKVQIQVANTELTVTKEELIKRFKEIFPNKYNFLKNSDFQISDSHQYLGDEQVRYDLYFQKTVKGKYLSGSATFVGENLQLESFNYNPTDVSDALFPAKLSKEQAQKIAENLIKKFSAYQQYELDENTINYFPQQLLTEPVRYLFSFVRTENGIPLEDQRVEIVILGNGDLNNFYRTSVNNSKVTFEDAKQIKAENDILQQIKKSLAVRLQYQINYDYSTGDRAVQLVYLPNMKEINVQATSGKWKRADGTLLDDLMQQRVEPLVEAPLSPRQSNITNDQVKQLAQNLLAVQSNDVKLEIESIGNMKNGNGQDVIAVEYMYQTSSGGTGTSLEIDKNTGDIIQYHNMQDELFNIFGEKTPVSTTLTKEAALEKAIQYLKQWSPSYLHHYAKPLQEPYFDEERGYMFTFPRIVNGILVEGDSMNVGIKADGTLSDLYVSYQELEWPSIENVIPAQQATQAFLDKLTLKLVYMTDMQKESDQSENDYYELVYMPLFNKDMYSYLDAKTGEWANMFGSEKMTTAVSHPRAEAELNYLIGAKILNVNDVKKFDADAPITQGEALSIVMKSITHFYEDYYRNLDDIKEPIKGINPKDPLYSVVERAISLGVLDESGAGFEADQPITRQELAAWYIRALDLEMAAEHSDIYMLNFDDAESVNKNYIGYVALANALDILPTEKNKFNPTKNVSYADVAMSVIKLA